MKYIRALIKINGIILFGFIFLFNLNAQQSSSEKIRPDHIDQGIVYNTSKDAIVIENVPSYIWTHGCGPTALGMVIGYYDMFGFSDLIPGDASYQTVDVNDAIANAEHYSDYSEPIDYYPDLYQDKSELGGAHISNSIADFMETSWSSENNRYGWSWSSMIDDSFSEFILLQNPDYFLNTGYEWFSESSWGIYKNEINNNRPVVLLVDSDGDGVTDHFVTGIGYDEANSLYGIYDTWDNNIHWYEWREMSDQYSWGIYGFNLLLIQFNISASANPSNGGIVFGSGTFDYEEIVELIASPAEGYEFVNWTENGNIISEDMSFIFNAAENLNLQANFSETSATDQIQDLLDFEIYPNPAENYIEIYLRNILNEFKNVKAALYDVTGNIVNLKQVFISSNKIRFNISNLKKGTYILKLETNYNTFYTKKIIIIK